MDDLLIARALHVLAVVVWIGGLAFVTLVILPAARRAPTPPQMLAVFEAAEAPFSRIARWAVAIAGASGLWLSHRLDLWSRFDEAAFWWMPAMAGLWTVFAVALFIAEPLWLHRAFRRWAQATPQTAFAWALWLHRLLLAAATVTIAGAVMGSH
jgi:uncharacterized membrane protein